MLQEECDYLRILIFVIIKIMGVMSLKANKFCYQNCAWEAFDYGPRLPLSCSCNR